MFGFREIDIEQLAARLEAGDDLRLLDVRTPGETARGVIPGAELVPLHLLPVKLDELRDARDLVIYCQTGARSAQACMFLAREGMAEASNLTGGIMAWVRSGRSLVEPLAAAAG
jgi:rhodanese-related sulfurtransferase